VSAFASVLLKDQTAEVALGQGAVADDTEEKTFHVHEGLCMSWWLPRT
jgi:hypothetical protein